MFNYLISIAMKTIENVRVSSINFRYAEDGLIEPKTSVNLGKTKVIGLHKDGDKFVKGEANKIRIGTKHLIAVLSDSNTYPVNVRGLVNEIMNATKNGVRDFISNHSANFVIDIEVDDAVQFETSSGELVDGVNYTITRAQFVIESKFELALLFDERNRAIEAERVSSADMLNILLNS